MLEAGRANSSLQEAPTPPYFRCSHLGKRNYTKGCSTRLLQSARARTSSSAESVLPARFEGFKPLPIELLSSCPPDPQKAPRHWAAPCPQGGLEEAWGRQGCCCSPGQGWACPRGTRALVFPFLQSEKKTLEKFLTELLQHLQFTGSKRGIFSWRTQSTLHFPSL